VGDPGTELQETSGLVLSTLTEEALRLDAGALLPAASEAAEAASLSITVPSEQEETVTVNDEPEPVEGVIIQPVADPVLLK